MRTLCAGRGPAVHHDSLPEPGGLLPGQPAAAYHKIRLFDLVAGMSELVGQFSVVRDEKKPFGVVVQPPTVYRLQRDLLEII